MFLKIVSKVAQDSKEKSHKSAVRRKKKIHKIIARNVEGGVDSTPPGLIRVNIVVDRFKKF